MKPQYNIGRHRIHLLLPRLLIPFLKRAKIATKKQYTAARRRMPLSPKDIGKQSGCLILEPELVAETVTILGVISNEPWQFRLQ